MIETEIVDVTECVIENVTTENVIEIVIVTVREIVTETVTEIGEWVDEIMTMVSIEVESVLGNDQHHENENGKNVDKNVLLTKPVSRRKYDKALV